MKKLALLLMLCATVAQGQVSYFNTGLLRQPSAALDRAYLGITTNAGPPGPTGPAGPAGPPGPSGTNAPNAVTNFYTQTLTLNGPSNILNGFTYAMGGLYIKSNVTIYGSVNASSMNANNGEITNVFIIQDSYGDFMGYGNIQDNYGDFMAAGHLNVLYGVHAQQFTATNGTPGIMMLGNNVVDFQGNVLSNASDIVSQGTYYGNGSGLSNVVSSAPTEAQITNALGATIWKNISGNAKTATTATNLNGGWAFFVGGTNTSYFTWTNAATGNWGSVSNGILWLGASNTAANIKLNPNGYGAGNASVQANHFVGPIDASSINDGAGTLTMTLSSGRVTFNTADIFQVAPQLQVTNAAPTSVTIGVTAPDIWFAVTNGTTRYMVPGWKNH